MKKTKRKIKVFCRLYKYTCAGCQKIRHKRHHAKPGETICDMCMKRQQELINQPTLFE